MHAANEEFQY